ncbi:MAG TPA: DsbA family protein [Acidimicrobiia bacterium]
MRFGVNFDYLCPFARNVNEAVLNGLDQGRDWDVRFWAFSLAQVHVKDGDPDVWDAPEARSGVLALQWGVAARDAFPELFPAVHRELFAARHDHGRDIKDESVIRHSVETAGADPDALAEVVATGVPLRTVETEHTESVDRWRVFGVPTFLLDEHATFVRVMRRGDVEDLVRTLDMLSWTDLNEFKRTRVPR